MNFGKNVSCLAASIAAVLGASSAYAVLPPGQGGPAAPDFVFYIGGGSAEPQPVQAAFCRLMNNVDSYTDTTVATPSTDSGTWRILYGTTKAAIAGGHIAINKNVLVLYKLNGGSYTNGGLPQTVAPPNAAAFLPYPDPATQVLAATTVPDGPAGNNGQACNAVNNGTPTQHYTKGATTNQAPDFGLTDLEVAAFSGVNNPTNAALNPVGAASGIYDLVFGIAATNALYAQKHNFSSAELAAILSGNITDWSALLGDQGAFVNAPLPAGPIVIIDRNVGSGHKTQSAAQFLGYPGLGANALLPQSASNFTGTGAGGVGCAGAQVFNNSGYDTGVPAQTACPVVPLQACDANYHDVFTSSAANTVVALVAQQLCAAPNNRAIGILSMDNPPSLNGNTYSFVSIDGKNVDSGAAGDTINGPPGGHTSYSNAIAGNYTDFYQANFNTRTGFLGGASANVDFAKAMQAQLAAPGLSGCVTGSKYPASTPGILADSDSQGSYGAGVPIVSRNLGSDALIPTLTQLPGNIVPCADPL
jgi:PBP superfamily domain